MLSHIAAEAECYCIPTESEAGTLKDCKEACTFHGTSVTGTLVAVFVLVFCSKVLEVQVEEGSSCFVEHSAAQPLKQEQEEGCGTPSGASGQALMDACVKMSGVSVIQRRIRSEALRFSLHSVTFIIVRSRYKQHHLVKTRG